MGRHDNLVAECKRTLDLLADAVKNGKSWTIQEDLLRELDNLIHNEIIPLNWIIEARLRIESWFERSVVTTEGMSMVDQLIENMIRREKSLTIEGAGDD